MEGTNSAEGRGVPPASSPLSPLPGTSREKRPEANRYFYDPRLFPHLDLLTRHAGLILSELQAALGCGIVEPHARNGAELSGVWCEDKRFEEFYNRTKNQQARVHHFFFIFIFYHKK